MKHFRLQLFKHGNSGADTAILAAAHSNGSKEPFTLDSIKKIGEAANSPDTSFEIVGETKMYIDAKGENGTYDNIAIIQEVQILEIEKSYSENDIEGVLN